MNPPDFSRALTHVNLMAHAYFKTMIKSNRFLKLGIWALALPLVWLLGLIVEIFTLSEAGGESGLRRFFESFVFFSSFLLYRLDWGLDPRHREFTEVLGPLALQFFLWWLLAFVILFAVSKKGQKF